MLTKLKQFFNDNVLSGLSGGQNDEHALCLATTALFLEMAGQDDHFQAVEREAVISAMKAKFKLSEKEVGDLLSLAEAELTQSTDYHQFTSLMQQHFSYEQKISVIEHLWEIAFADNHLDRYEEHLVRKIAELLFVRHSDFIAARHRVEQALSGS